MKKTTLLILILITGIGSISAQSLEKNLDNYFKKHLSQNPEQPIANILVYLDNEKNNFVYNKGFGALSISDDTAVEKDSPFKTASVTKMFTATLILQLVEEGKFKLNDPVINLIGELDFVTFDKLMMVNDKGFGQDITVGQLLNHTSGLADIFTDMQEEFMNLFFENTQKQWTPQDLFEVYYKFNLNNRAHNEPGEGFHYSDTNYFLLGLIVEKFRGVSLAQAYRSYILEPVGMKHSYFEYHEDATNGRSFPSSYMGTIEINQGINTSFDWAGGGLVSTSYDLSLFMKSLFGNKLIKSDALIKDMTTASGDKYGYGMILYNFEGVRFYGHSGFWGSDVFYSPDKNITMIISVNQTNLPFSHKKFIRGIYDLIK